MKKFLIITIFFLPQTALAVPVLEVPIHAVSAEGIGDQLGAIKISEKFGGLFIQPNVTKLSPGLHGFHVHSNPSCAPGEKAGKSVAAHAAGGHLEGGSTSHQGPYGSGHLGDLPILVVEDNGTASMALFAPRLKLNDVVGRSLMIHAGGDTYSDMPELGGGGDRIACGVIPKETPK